jgi:hypothetical protein
LEGTSHKVFPAKFGNGTTSFFNRPHSDESETLGALRAIIDDDLRIPDSTDAIEELKKVTHVVDARHHEVGAGRALSGLVVQNAEPWAMYLAYRECQK